MILMGNKSNLHKVEWKIFMVANHKPRTKPATPRPEADLPFFVLELLSNVCERKPRTLSQVALRPKDSSEVMPNGSKTGPLQLKNNFVSKRHKFLISKFP